MCVCTYDDEYVYCVVKLNRFMSDNRYTPSRPIYFCSIPVIWNASAALKQLWSVWWIQNEHWSVDCRVTDCWRWVIAYPMCTSLWFYVFFFALKFFLWVAERNTKKTAQLCDNIERLVAGQVEVQLLVAHIIRMVKRCAAIPMPWSMIYWIRYVLWKHSLLYVVPSDGL